MALKSSLAAQFGIGEEVTWGTAVTPTIAAIELLCDIRG